MADPVNFTSSSARFALPYLFAGQAQKEFYVNEAHARTDMLLHPAIEGERDEPPQAPADGEMWLVGMAPSGEWIGHQNQIACFQTGNWIFAIPTDGFYLFDKSKGQVRLHAGEWRSASSVTAPSDGDVVDSEARTAIDGLIAALLDAGILARN